MYQKFEQLVKARGITTYRVAKDLELAPTVFSDWKSGKSAKGGQAQEDC